MSRSLLKRLQAMAPGVEWTTPLPGSNYNKAAGGFLCRVCVAKDGYLAALKNGTLFANEEACLKHIETEHVAK